jgi:FixJ family two-component response regulator
VDLVHRARARARALRPSVRAVIITGFAEIDAFDPALHDSLVMTKPFKREALIRAVSGLVARRHRRQ